MRIFHNISVSVFIKPEEDYELVKKGFLELFPFDLVKEKIKLKEINASTFKDRTIKILEVRLEKQRHIRKLIDSIMEKMSSKDKKVIVRQMDTRIDDDCYFFFRLSKKKRLEGETLLCDHGDCYHFKCHVATYPESKEKAKEIVKELIS